MKNRWILCGFLLFMLAFIGWAFQQRKEISARYQYGIECYNNQDYEKAVEILSAIGVYKDASLYAETAQKWIDYHDAEEAYDSGDYETSARMFTALWNFENGKDMAIKSYKEIAKRY